jgi:hypothetical protein
LKVSFIDIFRQYNQALSFPLLANPFAIALFHHPGQEGLGLPESII